MNPAPPVGPSAASGPPQTSGHLPHRPERAQRDAVGHHGHQVDPEEQHVQDVAHLQPLLGHLPAPVPLLQEAADRRHLLQDVVHDGRRGVPGGRQTQAQQADPAHHAHPASPASLPVVVAPPAADLTGVVEAAASCRTTPGLHLHNLDSVTSPRLRFFNGSK